MRLFVALAGEWAGKSVFLADLTSLPLPSALQPSLLRFFPRLRKETFAIRTPQARDFSKPVYMHNTSTMDSITTYKNVHVEGSNFPAGAVVADVLTADIKDSSQTHNYRISLSTTSTKASFVAIFNVRSEVLGNANPERQTLKFLNQQPRHLRSEGLGHQVCRNGCAGGA